MWPWKGEIWARSDEYRREKLYVTRHLVTSLFGGYLQYLQLLLSFDVIQGTLIASLNISNDCNRTMVIIIIIPRHAFISRRQIFEIKKMVWAFVLHADCLSFGIGSKSLVLFWCLSSGLLPVFVFYYLLKLYRRTINFLLDLIPAQKNSEALSTIERIIFFERRRVRA